MNRAASLSTSMTGRPLSLRGSSGVAVDDTISSSGAAEDVASTKNPVTSAGGTMKPNANKK